MKPSQDGDESRMIMKAMDESVYSIVMERSRKKLCNLLLVTVREAKSGRTK